MPPQALTISERQTYPALRSLRRSLSQQLSVGGFRRNDRHARRARGSRAQLRMRVHPGDNLSGERAKPSEPTALSSTDWLPTSPQFLHVPPPTLGLAPSTSISPTTLSSHPAPPGSTSSPSVLLVPTPSLTNRSPASQQGSPIPPSLPEMAAIWTRTTRVVEHSRLEPKPG